jgi:hypothetical protein
MHQKTNQPNGVVKSKASNSCRPFKKSDGTDTPPPAEPYIPCRAIMNEIGCGYGQAIPHFQQQASAIFNQQFIFFCKLQ